MGTAPSLKLKLEGKKAEKLIKAWNEGSFLEKARAFTGLLEIADEETRKKLIAAFKRELKHQDEIDEKKAWEDNYDAESNWGW